MPSTRQRVMKSDDLNLKYDAAEKYFQKEDYYHALQLLETLLPAFSKAKSSIEFLLIKRTFIYAVVNIIKLHKK